MSERVVRDLPIGDWDTWLVFARARLSASAVAHGRAGALFDRSQRMTTRLAARPRGRPSAAVKHVAAWFRMSWDTVKQIDEQAREVAGLGRCAVGGSVVLVITNSPCITGIGMPRWSLRRGSPSVNRAGCAVVFRVKAAALCPDRSGGGGPVGSVRGRSPRALSAGDLVYKLFHVAANHPRAVIDRVRVDEADCVEKADGSVPTRDWRRVIKGTR